MLSNKEEKFLDISKIPKASAIKLGIRKSNTKWKRLTYLQILLY